MRNRVTKNPERESLPEQPVERLEPIEQISGIPLIDEAEVVPGFVVERRPDADLPLPPAYRVLETRSVMYAGSRVTIKKDKVIDERGYDLSKLIEQGVRLEPVEVM